MVSIERPTVHIYLHVGLPAKIFESRKSILMSVLVRRLLSPVTRPRARGGQGGDICPRAQG